MLQPLEQPWVPWAADYGELREMARERDNIGPTSQSPVVNPIEVVFVQAVNAQSTAAYLVGDTDDDEEFALLEEEVRTELRKVSGQGELEILTGFGPSPGSVLKFLLGFASAAYVLEQAVELPGAVRNLLRITGETLGFESLTALLPFVGEVQVAVYFRKQLLGTIELKSWADFRSSMKRAVWQQMRLRMEG